MSYVIIEKNQLKYLENLQDENNKLFMQCESLKRRIKELEKDAYPYSASFSPSYIDVVNSHLTLDLCLSIGQYPDARGNHIVARRYESDTYFQEFKYYYDTSIAIDLNRKDFTVEILTKFFNDLVEKL